MIKCDDARSLSRCNVRKEEQKCVGIRAYNVQMRAYKGRKEKKEKKKERKELVFREASRRFRSRPLEVDTRKTER